MFFDDELQVLQFVAGGQLGFVGQRQMALPGRDVEADEPAFFRPGTLGHALLHDEGQHDGRVDAAGQGRQIAVVGDALFEIVQEEQVGRLAEGGQIDIFR